MTLEAQNKYEVYDDERETSQNNKQGAETEIGCGNGNCKEGSNVKIKLENFTINVFFDGTGNNVHNTEFRLLDEEYSELSNQRLSKKGELKKMGLQDLMTDHARNNDNYQNRRTAHIDEARKQANAARQSQLEKEIAEIEQKIDRLVDVKEYKNRTYLEEPNVSYQNEFSNVALLHLGSHKFSKNSRNIYIEGAGTSKDDLDDTDGLGFASGEKSGVHIRINEAFNKISAAIEKVKAERYSINVFGFSRGSFYARVFCAWLKAAESDRGGEAHTHNLRYDFLKISPEVFNITLLGIYDTVSSHGKDHYNDPEGSTSMSPLALLDSDQFPLAITNDDQDIAKIVHLTAQNDYRDHFPLTPITATLKSQPTKGGSALEISFPGAHSNLGGAYSDVWIEKDHYISFVSRIPSFMGEMDGAINWKWWVNKGYYLERELTTKFFNKKTELLGDLPIINQKSTLPYYVANRGVRNHYQYITFGAMRMAAEKFGVMQFNEDQERLKERLKIFEQAKVGNDLNESEARKYQKQIDPRRARVLAQVDNAIREKMTQNLDKHGVFKFELSEVLPDIADQKCLYGTFICNSLQPISTIRAREFDFDRKASLESIVNDNSSSDKYDIRPEKAYVKKWAMPSVTVRGVENEGTRRTNHQSGKPTRPTVEGG